jgi:hypothetical protein
MPLEEVLLRFRKRGTGPERIVQLGIVPSSQSIVPSQSGIIPQSKRDLQFGKFTDVSGTGAS